MLNLLIVENNNEKCKNLIDTISHSNLPIKLYSIAYSNYEAINILKNSNIDIIFIDFSDVSNIGVLNYISENNLTKFYNSIMMFSNDLNLYNTYKSNKYINCIISNANNSKLVLYYLNKMLLEKKDFDKILKKN